MRLVNSENIITLLTKTPGKENFGLILLSSFLFFFNKTAAQ